MPPESIVPLTLLRLMPQSRIFMKKTQVLLK
jgi:hypothetical protein